MLARPPVERQWIQFLFYHWVLDDQRDIFRRQLQFLRNYGDFLSLDEAIVVLQSESDIGGRYFCLTFDDGFKSGFTNAVPVLRDLEIPASFFVPTKYIGLELDDDWGELASFYAQSWFWYQGFFEFLNWDECRQIAAAGFTLGSHSHSHTRLTELEPAEAEHELLRSKQEIELKLNVSCRHFCCPYGKLNRDFDPTIHPVMAQKLGYASFLTTEGGVNLRGASVFDIRRNGCEPDLTPSMLRYSLFSGRQKSS
jgi:peptidoglycan/xylan/chitin deacetylase (PgdA/CDA1 family)